MTGMPATQSSKQTIRPPPWTLRALTLALIEAHITRRRAGALRKPCNPVPLRYWQNGPLVKTGEKTHVFLVIIFANVKTYELLHLFVHLSAAQTSGCSVLSYSISKLFAILSVKAVRLRAV